MRNLAIYLTNLRRDYRRALVSLGPGRAPACDVPSPARQRYSKASPRSSPAAMLVSSAAAWVRRRRRMSSRSRRNRRPRVEVRTVASPAAGRRKPWGRCPVLSAVGRPGSHALRPGPDLLLGVARRKPGCPEPRHDGSSQALIQTRRSPSGKAGLAWHFQHIPGEAMTWTSVERVLVDAGNAAGALGWQAASVGNWIARGWFSLQETLPEYFRPHRSKPGAIPYRADIAIPDWATGSGLPSSPVPQLQAMTYHPMPSSSSSRGQSCFEIAGRKVELKEAPVHAAIGVGSRCLGRGRWPVAAFDGTR